MRFIVVLAGVLELAVGANRRPLIDMSIIYQLIINK